MEPVNILDARNNLSSLIAAASGGETVTISKRGKPVVRLVPVKDDAPTAGALAEWLTVNTVPVGAGDSTALDARITESREGWD